MSLSRSLAAQLASETVSISRSGQYQTSSGEPVFLRDAVDLARQTTRFYEANWRAAPLLEPRFETRFEVHNEPTLQAARRLFDCDLSVAALNFASAKNAGGGFLNGARAQEEYLCRNSALHACLEGHPFYDLHRALGGTFYTASALYSPAVPVIRAEDNSLCAPWPLSFLTAAAPNLNGERFEPSVVQAAFEERIARILNIALEQGHDALVLGAWGCGAFKNDPKMVARVFAEVLGNEFRGQFRHVAFAVLDSGAIQPNFSAFQAAFAGKTDDSS